jgi:hypothetical protein
MARIKDTVLYPLDTDQNLEEYVIGTNSDLGKTTHNYKLRDIWAAFNEAGPSVTILNNDIDGVTLYDYHGGIRYDGSWLVIRYDKADVAVRLVADEVSNPSFVDLATAWTNRATLTYT